MTEYSTENDLESLKPDFWTNADVGRWLKLNGFQHLIDKFREHDISGFTINNSHIIKSHVVNKMS